METIALFVAVTVAWLAIAAILLWSVVASLRRFLKDDGPLPLFALLERHGLTMRQAEESVGMNELAQAARRCALCSSRPNCSADPVWCPNEPLLRRLRGAGGAP
jgi:hypothetical protein